MDFLQLARIGHVCHICLDGLETTQRIFASEIPPQVRAGLSKGATSRETSKGYMSGYQLNTLLVDIRTLPGWRDRLLLLKEYAFPPANYMLQKYRTPHRHLLPLLYLRRAGNGLRKLISSALPR